MKKYSLLFSLFAAFATLTPHIFFAGLFPFPLIPKKLTIQIDRAYAKDLTNKDIPYYTLTSGNKTTRENFGIKFKTDEQWFRYFEPIRLPVKVFALHTKTPEKSKKLEPITINGVLLHFYKTELVKDPNNSYSTTERFTIPNETLKDSLKFIEVAIADTVIKTFNVTSKPETLLVPLEKDDLKKIVMAQGLVIRNELSEPLIVNYVYNNIINPFFARNDVITEEKTFYTRQPLINLGAIALEKLTISDARGRILTTFTPEELLKQPATEANPLIFRDFLPLTLTLDNQSDALLTLQKTVDMYNVSIRRDRDVIQDGTTVTTQESMAIQPHTKTTYELQTNTTKGKSGKITSNDEVQTFQITTFNAPQELAVFPNTPDYCSTSRFTLDLQDSENPLLNQKEKGKPFALTLTVTEEEAGTRGAFGSSCKKLIFTLMPTPAEKK